MAASTRTVEGPLAGKGLGMFLCLLGWLFLLAAPSTQAHPVSQGAMEITIAADRVKLTAVVSREEVLVASAFGAEKEDSQADKVRQHAKYLLAHVRVSIDGDILPGRVIVTPGEFSERLAYELEYAPITGIPRKVRVEQDVLREIEFAPGNQWEAAYLVHVHLVGQSGTQRFLLTHKTPLEIDCLSALSQAGGFYQETATFAAAFVRHGIVHILSGYDHLLFVAALLLAVTTFWDLVKVISAFTLAHTITLALAALDIFRVPGRIVEPLIAASIVFVALQNVFWPERSRGLDRLAVAFGFGLFHGLGFAGGLLGAMPDARAGGIGLAIFAFSLGVEIGHQLVVLPFFAALRLLRTSIGRKPWHDLLVQRGGSAGISFAGAIYLIAALR